MHRTDRRVTTQLRVKTRRTQVAKAKLPHSKGRVFRVGPKAFLTFSDKPEVYEVVPGGVKTKLLLLVQGNVWFSDGNN